MLHCMVLYWRARPLITRSTDAAKSKPGQVEVFKNIIIPHNTTIIPPLSDEKTQKHPQADIVNHHETYIGHELAMRHV